MMFVMCFYKMSGKPNDKFTVIGGLRYMMIIRHTKSKLSPKLATQYKVNSKLRINASYGAGFKAPDFRQLFLKLYQ